MATNANDLTLFRGGWSEMKARLPDIVLHYDTEAALAIDRLKIKGKTGAEALKDQTAWPIQYGVRKAELDKLVKFVELQIDSCRGRHYKKYTENYSRVLGDRAIEKYIDHEDEYIKLYEIYLELQELREKYIAICDAWDKRGFALRDWTQLRIAELQETVI